MVYFSRFDAELASQQTLDALSARCSPQRLVSMERFRRLSDRVDSCGVYALLRYALKREYGIDEKPYFYFGPFGKPILTNCRNIHFNLSHSHGLICAGVSDAPIGVDIQQTISETGGVEELFCSEGERALLKGGIELTRIWAVKESYFKCVGTGIPERSAEHDICTSAEESFRSCGRYFTVLGICGGALAVCSERREKIHYVDPNELMS